MITATLPSNFPMKLSFCPLKTTSLLTRSSTERSPGIPVAYAVNRRSQTTRSHEKLQAPGRMLCSISGTSRVPSLRTTAARATLLSRGCDWMSVTLRITIRGDLNVSREFSSAYHIPRIPQLFQLFGAHQKLFVVTSCPSARPFLIGDRTAYLAVAFCGRPDTDMDCRKHGSVRNHQIPVSRNRAVGYPCTLRRWPEINVTTEV